MLKRERDYGATQCLSFHYVLKAYVILCGLYCHRRKTITSSSSSFKKLGLLSPWWLTHHSLCFLASSWRSSTAALWDHHALDAKSCALAEWRQFEWGNTQIKSMKKVKVPVNVFGEGKEWIWAQKNGKKNEIVRAKMWWCLRLFKEWGLKRNPVRPCIGVVRWSKVRKGKTFFFLSLTGSSAW